MVTLPFVQYLFDLSIRNIALAKDQNNPPEKGVELETFQLSLGFQSSEKRYT